MKEMRFETAKVKITGMVSLLIDRFIDMSADERPPEQKLYLAENNQLVFPSENIFSFLYAENPAGCAKTYEGKKWKEYKTVGMAHTAIKPEFIPITRNDKPIIFKKFVNEYDKDAKIRILHHKASVKKGSLVIPSPKTRPCIETPWELNFELTIFDNSLINLTKLENWFTRGGLRIAIGTYRPRFGRFTVEFS